MAEPVDAGDLKSPAPRGVRVRVPPSAPLEGRVAGLPTGATLLSAQGSCPVPLPVSGSMIIIIMPASPPSTRNLISIE